MLNGYTYYKHKILRDGFRWSCTQMGSRSCRGFLHVTNEMLVIRAFIVHTHEPSTYMQKRAKLKGGAKKSDSYAKKDSESVNLNPLAVKIVSIQGSSSF